MFARRRQVLSYAAELVKSFVPTCVSVSKVLTTSATGPFSFGRKKSRQFALPAFLFFLIQRCSLAANRFIYGTIHFNGQRFGKRLKLHEVVIA